MVAKPLRGHFGQYFNVRNNASEALIFAQFRLQRAVWN
jgi:hypothetical protein